MANVETMAITQSRNDLTEKTDSFFFREWTIFGNIVEKLSALDVFENKISIIMVSRQEKKSEDGPKL